MNITDKVNVIARDTMGYLEAENKDDFMTGVGVGSYKTEELYQEQINGLTLQLETYKRMYEVTSKDIKMLSYIIKKYSEE